MTGIVLGSGLGPLADAVQVNETVSFEKAGLPASTVPGHQGSMIIGKLGNEPVVLMSGRVHLYEGHTPQSVTEGVAWMAKHGIHRLILTNAAGSLNPDFQPGTWMMLSDHLNLTGCSPLSGASFIDMTNLYDADWREEISSIAAQCGMQLHSGVYASLRGPQYETPAEVRMLRTLGADAVGMSTVLEAIRARSLGIKVLAFSCLTNWAAGISPTPLDHQEVIDTGKQAAADMIRLLQLSMGGS
ncbi:MAG: purine-nucleoside phosphorylase [Luteolibacter sp.]